MKQQDKFLLFMSLHMYLKLNLSLLVHEYHNQKKMLKVAFCLLYISGLQKFRSRILIPFSNGILPR